MGSISTVCRASSSERVVLEGVLITGDPSPSYQKLKLKMSVGRAILSGKSSIVVVREGTVVSGKSIVYIGTVGRSDHFAKPDKIITIPDKITIQKHVMKGITLKKVFVVVLKGKLEDVYDSNIERLLRIITLWRRAKEKQMDAEFANQSDSNIKVEKGVQHKVHGIGGMRKLTDDNNLDSDAYNFRGLDGQSVLAAFAKQYGVGLDTPDKSICTAMPLGVEVSDTSTNQSLPDEIVNQVNESIVSIDHSRTSHSSPTEFLSSDRDMMFVKNGSAETVSAKKGVSHRGVSTESRNRVSNTGNVEVESIKMQEGDGEGEEDSADTEKGEEDVKSVATDEGEGEGESTDTEGEEEDEESADTATEDQLGSTASTVYQPHVGNTGMEQEVSKFCNRSEASSYTVHYLENKQDMSGIRNRQGGGRLITQPMSGDL